jgi:hypothetical protein
VRALTPKAAMAAVLIAVASPASAAVITYSAEIPSDQTDFSTTVGIPKFDPTLGTLTSVSFTLFGEVTGDLWVENRNRSNAVTGSGRQRPGDRQLHLLGGVGAGADGALALRRGPGRAWRGGAAAVSPRGVSVHPGTGRVI